MAHLEDPYLVPAGIHVEVLDGEHHEEHEEESHGREEVPQVMIIEDQDGTRRVQVSVKIKLRILFTVFFPTFV